MAWSSLTITRDDVNAFEKQTFRGLNVQTGNTVLNIDEDDNLVIDKAKQELESDTVDRLRHLINDGTYDTETELLDAIEAVDTRDLLKTLLTYKFLELWFKQDATHMDSKAMQDAQTYYSKYVDYLSINLQRLAGQLSSPKSVGRYKFKSTYA